MLTRSSRGVVVVFLLAGLFAGVFGGGTKRADADTGAAFFGGMMAGHVVTRFAAERRAQTEAMQSMAYGGGAAGPGRPMTYGPPPPAPPAVAPQPTPQQQLNQLDALAAGGYITPEEYKARRQAILNAM